MVVLKFVESLQNLFIQTFINRNYHKYLAIRSMSVFFDHFTGHGRAKYCFSYFQNQWVTTVLMICDMLIFKQIQFLPRGLPLGYTFARGQKMFQ